jgi:hypothetical protein
MTRTLELVHPRETLVVPVQTLLLKCGLFSDDPLVHSVPYSVQAPVSVNDFRQFVSALEDKDVEVTNVNFGGLSLLCDEFRFEGLSERLSAFRQSADFKEAAVSEDSEARLNFSALEERLLLYDHKFAALQDELARQSQAQESTAAVLTEALNRLSRIIADGVQMDSGTKAALALETELGRLAKAQEGLERALATATVDVVRLSGNEFAALRETQESTTEALTYAFLRLSQIEAAVAKMGSGAKAAPALETEPGRLSGDEFAALRQAQESTAAVLTEALNRLSQIEAKFVQMDSGTKVPLTLETELGRLAKAQEGLERALATVTADVVRLSGDEFAALRQAQESTTEALTATLNRLSRVEEQFEHAPVSPPNAADTPRVPEPVQRTPPSAKAVIPDQATAAPAPALSSAILSDFPEIFDEFRGKQFSLLWRGGRDGFSARAFHDRCDGRANTLTLIQDTKGNIFGGFTPLEWQSRRGWKADASLKSFLFTLKNPCNVPARRFALKDEKKGKAIYCTSELGPGFGESLNGISVCNHCNTNTSNSASFGYSYTNDTGLDGQTFFTGSVYFQVKEIEVFEIKD